MPEPLGGDSVDIRASTEADLAGITAIYAHHVLTGLATFETDPPCLAEMARRRADILDRGLPHMVAVDARGAVLGYAYAGPYRARVAYRYTLEDSIYLDPAATGRGIGSRLIAEIVTGCANLGYRQMIAVIGDSANAASIALHARAGFAHCGIHEAVGFKFGRWVDTVQMQRPLGPGRNGLPPSPRE